VNARQNVRIVGYHARHLLLIVLYVSMVGMQSVCLSGLKKSRFVLLDVGVNALEKECFEYTFIDVQLT
jgi:hypothetical protein